MMDSWLSCDAQVDSHRVMTFSNEEDVVFFRHHMYEKRGGKEVVLNEVGPRFEMQLYQLRLGTLDQVGNGVSAALVLYSPYNDPGMPCMNLLLR